jgi:hypothetical protein
MTTYELISYLYVQTAEQIHSLKIQAYQATEHEKYAYASPDGKSFRNDRPSDELMAAGWTYKKVKYDRATSFMNPKHSLWADYQNSRRRARELMAAKLMLKMSNGEIPEKTDAGTMVGALESQARASDRKDLAARSIDVLRKLDNRLKRHPAEFAAANEWLAERSVAHAA